MSQIFSLDILSREPNGPPVVVRRWSPSGGRRGKRGSKQKFVKCLDIARMWIHNYAECPVTARRNIFSRRSSRRQKTTSNSGQQRPWLSAQRMFERLHEKTKQTRRGVPGYGDPGSQCCGGDVCTHWKLPYSATKTAKSKPSEYQLQCFLGFKNF